LRRFLGDNWLEALLQLLTLYAGWLIWFAFVAPKGQTPAKQLQSVYIHSYDSGAVASWGRVWMREIVGKFGIPWFISIAAVLQTGSIATFFAGNLFFLIGGLTVLFNEDRRALWDYIAGTAVRHHPQGAPSRGGETITLANSRAAHRLAQLERLKSQGLITEAEYLTKRRDILASV
jgi:uncharacterized RDD family membrane protein YckC